MAESEIQLKAWMLGGLGGDAAAHAALLSALVPLLRSFFRRRLRGSVDDAEDLLQETLISVHTRRIAFDRDQPFTPWLYAIARYRLIDHFRRRRQAVPLDELEDALLTEGFEDQVTASIDVSNLLESLSRKQARAIRDTHIEGMSVVEAATGAGIGVADVKVSVHRGLKALAEKLAGKRR
jgi:RNA polymerase sigma factor (sigma-70 family)